MKNIRGCDNRNRARIWRGVGLLLTSCFFLGVVALAIHHHGAFFKPHKCSICKAKTYFSGTFSKVKADPPPVMAGAAHCSEETYLIFTMVKFHHQTPFISSLSPNPFLNKAPPFIS
jgi:hypothetical protein